MTALEPIVKSERKTAEHVERRRPCLIFPWNALKFLLFGLFLFLLILRTILSASGRCAMLVIDRYGWISTSNRHRYRYGSNFDVMSSSVDVRNRDVRPIYGCLSPPSYERCLLLCCLFSDSDCFCFDSPLDAHSSG